MLGETIIVVWEGVDGAGKTTLMKRVRELLEQRGFKVSSYKTPSMSPTGRFARDYGNSQEIDHLTRMLLFLANTSDDSKIMRREIGLSNPKYYFIDRYYLCSLVYGFAFSRVRGVEVGAEEFMSILELVEKIGRNVFLDPDLYIILDVAEEARLKRLGRRESQGGLENILERSTSMQEYVREFYRVFKEAREGKVLWVENVEGKLEETARQIEERLLRLRAKL